MVPERAPAQTHARLRLLRHEASAPSSRRAPLASLRAWVRRMVGRMAHGLRLPGAIRPVTVDDPTTGHRLEVTVDATYVVLKIDGRDYYFRRVSGEYDGSGTSV
jgi:hypothetical protein